MCKDNQTKEASGFIAAPCSATVDLPCPFCGGKDIRFTEHRGMGNRRLKGCENLWSTCCYDCGATFANRYKKQLLVDQWNRRPQNIERADS